MMYELSKEFWRRRPDLNRGWRFCRPLPYHLATAPAGTVLVLGGVRPRLSCGDNSDGPAEAGRYVRSRLRAGTSFDDSARLSRSSSVARSRVRRAKERRMERETGFEPATSTLARSHSTTELFPPVTNG